MSPPIKKMFEAKDYSFIEDGEQLTIEIYNVERKDFPILKRGFYMVLGEKIRPIFTMKKRVMSIIIRICPEKVKTQLTKLFKSGDPKKIFGG